MAKPLETKIAFQSLAFENGQALILPSMDADLGKLGILSSTIRRSCSGFGHTDSQGSEEINRKLSQARADAIRQYLIDHFAIDPGRITAIGYGSSKPLVEETSEEQRQLNRRVEFEIYRE